MMIVHLSPNSKFSLWVVHDSLVLLDKFWGTGSPEGMLSSSKFPVQGTWKLHLVANIKLGGIHIDVQSTGTPGKTKARAWAWNFI